jgi:hypothetical protein
MIGMGIELATLGGACIVAAVALTWLAMPNKEGVSPRFVRHDFMQILFPVFLLGLAITGFAALLRAGG